MSDEQIPGGGRLSEDIPFRPLNIAVLTISDTRDEASDTSGKLLADRVIRDGHCLAARRIVTDDIAEIQSQMKAWIDDPAGLGRDELLLRLATALPALIGSATHER